MRSPPIADVEAGFRWLEAFTNLEVIRASRDRQMYRLDRMEYLLGRFADPHLACRTIHVAGSKGKGSTAAYLAAALSSGGHRTGLYTSPHVSSYRERIEIDGSPVDDGMLLRWMNEVRGAVDEIPPGTLPISPTPTTFELLTLLAFLVFRDAGARYAVIEVGIGGRLDATNVVRPEVAVITPIELEHTDILGDTIEAIAREKGGIIKDGVPVVSAAQRPAARGELERLASERGAPITFLDDVARIEDVEVSRAGTRFAVAVRGRLERFTLSLPGRFQAENAALALLALRALPEPPADGAIRRGFALTVLPGRMESMRSVSGPPVVLDGAHTPASVKRAAETFLEMYPRGGVLLFGSVAGKRTDEMAEALAPLFRTIVISRPNPFKESSPDEVFAAFRRRHAACALETDPERALLAACAAAGEGQAVLATGSFYMISEIRRHLMSDTGRSLLDGRLQVLTGDITALEVDAIVNAANSSLLGGGGVDGAIHRKGGPEILASCQQLRRTSLPDGLPPGQAVVTTAGRLKARHVIHTVGPVYRDGRSGEAETLGSAYRESLARAAEIGARTVAFPAISTGVYGYPKAEAARVAFRTIAEALSAHPLPHKVLLVFFTEADAASFLAAVGGT